MRIKSKHIKLVACDLDGTLLHHNKPVSASTPAQLRALGRKGVVRVIATGRSHFSAKKALHKDFPIDYLALSGGAALMDWRTGKILYAHELDTAFLHKALYLLKKYDMDFMLHEPLPENHRFFYHHNGHKNDDFDRRLEMYSDFAGTLAEKGNAIERASRFVVVLRKGQKFPEALYRKLGQLNIIRSTSPLDHESEWIEIYPGQASKASAIQFICDKLGIGRDEVLTIGNDYNDLDMLQMTPHSFVLSSAPAELREAFTVLRASTENALESVIKEYFEIEGIP